MCSVGLVIGISNFWTFPALMVQHGGLVFLGFYLVALILFAVPLMVMQVAIGKHSGKTLLATMSQFSPGRGFSLWKLCGMLLLAAATITVVLYAVVAGMGMAYVFAAAFGDFNVANVAVVADAFYDLQQDSEQMLLWLTLFGLVVFVISLRGIHRGLGLAIQYFIPVLVVLLFSLLAYSVRIPGLNAVHEKLFVFHWGEASWFGLLAAFKHAFFSLALGTGVFLLLGTYMPKTGHITRVVGLVAGIDMLVGILAGIIIIPWLSVINLPTDQGFSLVFHSVPLALGSLPFGQFFGAMYYVLLTLAAWSSAIILIEPAVAMVEEVTEWKRLWAAFLVHLLVWSLGAVLVISLTTESIFQFNGVSLFNIVEFVVATVLIPVAGCLMVLLFVFILPMEKLAAGLGMRVDQGIFRLGYPFIRFFCFPLLVAVQLAVVFDLLIHSCQFDTFRQGALCVSDAESVRSPAPVTSRENLKRLEKLSADDWVPPAESSRAGVPDV